MMISEVHNCYALAITIPQKNLSLQTTKLQHTEEVVLFSSQTINIENYVQLSFSNQFRVAPITSDQDSKDL